MLELLLALTLTAAPAKSDPTACAPGKATELLEQGRAVQKEKGEDGAEEAMKLYADALAADPRCAPALWELGWSAQSKGDLEAAVEAWKKLKALAPDYPELAAQFPQLEQRLKNQKSLAALPDPGKLPPVDEKPKEGEPISIAAVGDVQMGRAWPAEYAKLPTDIHELFTAVKPTLAKADIAFGNLETVLADTGESNKCRKGSTKCFAFRVPTDYAKALKETGFDVMSIANNHAGDFGPEGRKATMAALDKVGILHSGPVGDVATWETKGLKFALVAFSFGSDVYRIQELDIGRRLVADLAKKHDIVIVSFHAGAEGRDQQHVPQGVEKFLGENRGDSRAFAHAMIDAGADLALGHGPHVIRGMERYKGRLIAYSMGNFCSWDTFGLAGPLGVSEILELKLAPNGVALAAKVNPLVLEKPGKPVPDAEKQAISFIRKLSKDDFGSELIDEGGEWKRD